MENLEETWEKMLVKLWGRKEVNQLKKLVGKRIPIGESMARAWKQWYLGELAGRERRGEVWMDNVSGILEDVMLD